MAECRDCGEEMLESKKCSFHQIRIDGEWYDRDVAYYDLNERCHDCNVINVEGNLHHFGCDVEQCPRCGGQLISCNCKKEGLGKLL